MIILRIVVLNILFLKFSQVGRKALPFAGKKLYTSKPSIQGNNKLVYFENLKIIMNLNRQMDTIYMEHISSCWVADGQRR